MSYRGQNKDYHSRATQKLGVLLTNLGTPEAPTAKAVRPYLREFLSDTRVIELPKLLWWPILHGIVLRLRPAKSAKLYESVWTEQGSPLMDISLRQTEKLQAAMNEAHPDKVVVKLAMRYGQPAIGKVLQSFQDEGINRLVILPLYPQYSGPTTGSTFDAASKELASWRWMPELHFINTYHDHPLYIQALSHSIQRHIDQHGMPEKLVFSYHGMPQRYLESGDPYYCFCHKTTRLVAECVQLREDQYINCFQSLFGKAEWIRPYTSDTLRKLATEGVKHIAVICPGFSADCLETIEEIEVENRDVFIDAGGDTYHYIPALNDEVAHITMMQGLIEPYTH